MATRREFLKGLVAAALAPSLVDLTPSQIAVRSDELAADLMKLRIGNHDPVAETVSQYANGWLRYASFYDVNGKSYSLSAFVKPIDGDDVAPDGSGLVGQLGLGYQFKHQLDGMGPIVCEPLTECCVWGMQLEEQVPHGVAPTNHAFQ